MSDFVPSDHFLKMKGQDYLETKYRVVWFRLDHADGQITTEIVSHDTDNRSVIFKATVTVPSTGACATGYCEGDHNSFKHGYLEKAETQAIGRALAFLGYGTAQASELDTEEGDKLADSPVTVSATGEERKRVAAQVITKLGYRPNFEQWQGLARTHGIEPPVGPDNMDTAFLTRVLTAIDTANIR